MPMSVLRALRAVFPPRSIPVSTLPTQAEARALGALLVAQGRRAVIAPAAQGFIVCEVAA